MHIAAMDPKYVRREDVPEAVLAQEREIHREKALKSGKPANVIDKIVEGQLNKFLAEVCVYEQPFVKNDSVTIGQLLTERSLPSRKTSVSADFPGLSWERAYRNERKILPLRSQPRSVNPYELCGIQKSASEIERGSADGQPGIRR